MAEVKTAKRKKQNPGGYIGEALANATCKERLPVAQTFRPVKMWAIIGAWTMNELWPSNIYRSFKDAHAARDHWGGVHDPYWRRTMKVVPVLITRVK